jgi:hypothetical protein
LPLSACFLPADALASYDSNSWGKATVTIQGYVLLVRVCITAAVGGDTLDCPLQVASPTSNTVTSRDASRLDLSSPRVYVHDSLHRLLSQLFDLVISSLK